MGYNNKIINREEKKKIFLFLYNYYCMMMIDELLYQVQSQYNIVDIEKYKNNIHYDDIVLEEVSTPKTLRKQEQWHAWTVYLHGIGNSTCLYTVHY